jgi:hypothetical protein
MVIAFLIVAPDSLVIKFWVWRSSEISQIAAPILYLRFQPIAIIRPEAGGPA